MSVAVMAWAWRQEISSPQKMVLLALADHSDDDGLCWPGQKGLAIKTGLSLWTVNKLIKKLDESGHVETVRRLDAVGRPLGNTYRLCLDSKGILPDEQVQVAPRPTLELVDEQVLYNHHPEPSRETSKHSSARARTFPPDFELTDSDKEFARSRGMTDIGEEVVKFITYHESKNNKFSDWHKAWRTWALNYRGGGVRASPDPARSSFSKGMDNLNQQLERARANGSGRDNQTFDARQRQLVPPTDR